MSGVGLHPGYGALNDKWQSGACLQLYTNSGFIWKAVSSKKVGIIYIYQEILQFMKASVMITS